MRKLTTAQYNGIGRLIAIVALAMLFVALVFTANAPAAKPDPLAARVAVLEAQNKTLLDHIDQEFILVYEHLNYLKQHGEALEFKVDMMQQPIVLRKNTGPQEAKFRPCRIGVDVIRLGHSGHCLSPE